MVANVRERLAVSKQVSQKFGVGRFNLRMLNELEVRKQYRIKISSRFAALENLSDREGINKAWEDIQVNVKTSAKETLCLYELKQHKPWFDEECLGFLDQSKQAKMQWLDDPNQSNVDYLNTVRHEASKHFRDKKKAYLKVKIDELETNSKIKNIKSQYKD